MKLPRDISGAELIRVLQKLGYEITRQSGSHIRLTRFSANGDCHLTIPNHSPLRVGTLHAILTQTAGQSEISLEQLLILLK